jgi:glycosyltransferase involved in cell wall biosynthesis
LPTPSAYLTPIRLAVAAPAFNEEEGIRLVIEGWHRYLGMQRDIESFEIVVCDDGSRDATGRLLDELASEYREIRPIHFKRNQGAAVALTAAIAATTLDWVLLTDSDDQFPIDNTPKMIAEVQRRQAPAAIGIRQKKDRFAARLGTSASGLTCNLIHGSSLKDFNSAFKLVWGPLLRSLNLEAKGMNYSTEITSRLLECGVPIVEVEIEHRQRKTGASKMKMLRGASDRAWFVAYVGMRQLLLKLGVLKPLNLGWRSTEET